MWLPPVNGFPHYTINLIASQDELPPKVPSSSTRSLPHFAITVHVQVRFSTISGSELGFQGLNYTTQEFLIPCRALTHSPPKKAEKILGAKFSQLRIPFRLHNVMFNHKFYGEDSSLSLDKNWVAKLQQFLLSMQSKSYNFRRNVLPLSLIMNKSVIIPDKVYKDWRCWFRFSRKLDPDFKKKYVAAISRPRTHQELLCGPIFTFDEAMTAVLKDVRVSSFGGSTEEACSICLEDLSDGKGGLKGLCCGHVFHGDCIKKWFLRSQVCPLCRGTLPFRMNLMHLV